MILKKKINMEEKTINQGIRLLTFNGITKFKSIRRAIRRGDVSAEGVVYPSRPFNNRKDRPLEDKKRAIYKELIKYGRRNTVVTI